LTGDRHTPAAEPSSTDGDETGADEPRESEGRETEESLRRMQLRRGTNRKIRAARPRPGAERLRAAYLDLLKLSLCDLAGARTVSVSRSGDTRRPDSQIRARELPDEELVLRATGHDWPFSGLTMVGLKRLDDIQACVESVVADGVPGDVIEAGAWRGGASILARATLDSLGADDRTVWVADSFQGLPAPNPDVAPEDHELDLSQVDFLAVPVEEVRGYFARFGLDHGLEFVEGFFDETLPSLRGHRWSTIRLDGDTYEATWVALESLYPGLSAGGYLVVDDYGLIDACQRAVDDYRREHGITEPIERIDWNGVRWRRESEPAPIAADDRQKGDRPGRGGRGRKPAGESVVRPHIPTQRELELGRELRKARQRLRSAEGELERLRSSRVEPGRGRREQQSGS
jgi:O-methyltransferase